MIKHFINNLKTKKKSLKRSNYNYLFKTSLFILFSIVLFLSRKEIINDYKPLNKFNYLNNRSKKRLLIDITKMFNEKGYVNINEIESKIFGGKPWNQNKNKSNEINVGSSLDSGYILQTMMTIASVIDSQKLDTKLKLHFAVVKNFRPINMLKIYTLRKRIREDVEFNFYNASIVDRYLNGLSPKGPGLYAKLILPQLLNDDIKRLIIIDTGDVLVLRDLTEMYNWNMGDNIYMGVPDPGLGKLGIFSNKSLNIYINVGNYLIDVKKVKLENMFKKFTKYRHLYKSILAEQDMLNDLANGKVGYLPIKFGLISPFFNDSYSDIPPFNTIFQTINLTKINYNNSNIPYNYYEYNLQSLNPVIVHHWNAKWMDGNGISVYRRLAQYYIRLAGIWDETCRKLSGYCQK